MGGQYTWPGMTNPIKQAWRMPLRCLYNAGAAFAVLVALSANAAPTGEVDPGVIEEVIVTGTWIPGTPEDDALPVNRIDREDLAAEGSPGVIELVRNLSFSQGADGESDQYGSRTGADRATVNLRGLGPSRTLVMLNSHRLPWSPGSVPDQAQLVVDVNLLPMAALSRIEVLRDGATATYGSDAVSGRGQLHHACRLRRRRGRGAPQDVGRLRRRPMAWTDRRPRFR